MWTFKRILLLLGGLTLFLVFYGVYSYFLGAIDGLPPLAAEHLPGDGPEMAMYAQPTETEADRKLRFAFGPECPEVKRVIRLEVARKGIAFATNDFKIQDDGRVLLEPFSIALFSKNRQATTFPEINSVRADRAFLTFDRPIKNPADATDRKIVGAELQGKITIINNRRTAQTNDDVSVHITQGPLYFSDEKKLIWSDGVVRLVDTQPPEPTIITAKGLRIHLAKDAALPGRKKDEAKAEARPAVSSVEKIVLLHFVDMHLFLDSRSGFLSGSQAGARLKPPADEHAEAPGRAKVVIKTPGSFTFNVAKDLAVFEAPPRDPRKAPFIDDRVQVWRINAEGKDLIKSAKNDQLLCDRLELQFRPKKGASARAPRGGRSSEKDIESARALAHKGSEVTLVIDSENLGASGQEMIYRSPTEERGAETVVCGTPDNPMWAVKDLHKITALELRLVAANAQGKGQQAEAKGPGQIDLMDGNGIDEKGPEAAEPRKRHPYHACWRDHLTIVKAKEGETEMDLLTFTGDAAFLDDNGRQELRADKLQVWLEPAERLRTPEQVKEEKKHTAATAPRQQPHKLEGFGKVRVVSPELRVRDCDHLFVRFKDGPPSRLPDLPPAVAQTPQGDIPGYTVQHPGQGEDILLPPMVPGAAPPADTAKAAPDANRPGASLIPGRKKAGGKPIDLSARDVTVYVLRAGGKHELRQVITEGNVHVQQEGEEGKGKGFDIRGEILKLDHNPEGSTLTVLGDRRGDARLILGDITLVGPKVTIDQLKNTALVEGRGAMQAPSRTTLDGDAPAKPGTKITIHWNDWMFFNGMDADFHGRVQAHQDDAYLLCENMLVTLDRKVSFREGQAQAKGAGVERLTCSKRIAVADMKKDLAGQLLRVDRLQCTELIVDNKSGPVTAQGPGRVEVFQQGTMELDPVKKPDTNRKQMFLTRIDYTGKLWSQKYADKSRKVTIRDNVEVFHVPADNPNVKIDPERLPKDGLHLRCQVLTLRSTPVKDGKSTQYLEATNGATFRTDVFTGGAEMIKYDQADELVIFIGRVGNLAWIARSRGPGLQPEIMRGTEITFNRRTGKFTLSGGKVIEGGGK